jgi:uncharacterized membrane protein
MVVPPKWLEVYQTGVSPMNSEMEKQARWYAIKHVLILVGIIGSLIGITYINIIYSFIVIGIFLVVAIYTDAYHTKRMELERNDRLKN